MSSNTTSSTVFVQPPPTATSNPFCTSSLNDIIVIPTKTYTAHTILCYYRFLCLSFILVKIKWLTTLSSLGLFPYIEMFLFILSDFFGRICLCFSSFFFCLLLLFSLPLVLSVSSFPLSLSFFSVFLPTALASASASLSLQLQQVMLH